MLFFFNFKTAFGDIDLLGKNSPEQLRFCINKADVEQVEPPGCSHLLLFYSEEFEASHILLGETGFPKKASSADWPELKIMSAQTCVF